VQLLKNYQPAESDRASVAERIISFVESCEDCAERSHLEGHLTGSAWVVNPSRTKALLMHHRKLDKWMQPGGHADGEVDLFEVALLEAREESGLENIHPVSREVFDVDIHEIPRFKDVPPHYHYDVRFLFEADDSEHPQRNDESHEVAWIELTEISKYTDEESVLRMARVCRV
jgi:8-oxo-dGTP pyrophosphatase MutT (NUDIX family)